MVKGVDTLYSESGVCFARNIHYVAIESGNDSFVFWEDHRNINSIMVRLRDRCWYWQASTQENGCGVVRKNARIFIANHPGMFDRDNCLNWL